MEWLLNLTLLTSALLLLIQQGFCDNPPSKEEGILCYVCNSKDDPRCGHPFQADAFKPLNCSDLYYMKQYSLDLMAAENKTVPNLCRKNIQTVTLSGKTDFRIVRSCGFLPKNKPKYGVEVDDEDTGKEDRCYKRSGTFEVAVTYCTCTTDECNGARMTTSTTGGLTLLASLLLTLPIFSVNNP